MPSKRKDQVPRAPDSAASVPNPGTITLLQGRCREQEFIPYKAPPAYGLYARNVRGLRLNHIRFDVERPDLRPAIMLDHVSDAELNRVSVHGNEPLAKRSGSSANASDKTFNATSRLSLVSLARYTSPMPPPSRGARIS